MSAIYRITENMEQFTTNERRIAKYILKNTDFVMTAAADDVAGKIKTSPASLVRFSKTLGYKGFSELKVELAKDFKETEENLNNIICQDDTLDVLVRKSRLANEYTFRDTYRLLNMSNLEDAIGAAKKAPKIYLFGLGGSGVVCEDLYQKLLRINVDVVYDKDSHIIINSLSHARKGELAIALSYSGETREIIVAQRIAKEKGLTTIGITQVGRSSLTKYSDYVFQIPKEETELRLGSIASRFSMLAITDLIYLGIAQSNAEEYREKIIQSRKIVKEFRQ